MSKTNTLAVAVVVLAACRESPPSGVTTPPHALAADGDLAAAPVDASADVAAVEASADASAERADVCFPPVAGDFDRCPKGAMAGEEGLRACRERHAADPARRPTFRVGDRATVPFSKTTWRCVAVRPDTKVHVTVDTIAGMDVTVPSSCASHALDMIGPNSYGAVFFRCSTRARRDDEELPSD